MFDFLVMGHLTASELPQFSLYVMFAFVLGVSLAAVWNASAETEELNDNE